MTKVINNHLATTAPRFEATRGTKLIEIKDGLVIYQRAPERVHRLNRSAAVIYLLCDGSLTAAEIAQEAQNAFNTTNVPHSVVDQCLRQLTEAQLIRLVDDDADDTDQMNG